MQALCNGVIKALQILLLRQPQAQDGAAWDAVRQALARCGAGGLLSEVRGLASRLGAIAAVSEAVHGATYCQQSSNLL